MRRKKAFSVLLAAAMATSVFSGMTIGVEASEGDSGDYVFQELEDAEITFFNYSIESKELYEQEIAAYEAIHPNIKINMQLVGGGTDWRSTLKAQISSGETPEIIALEGASDFAVFGDMLEDLSGEPWLEHVYENNLSDITVDGKVVAAPTGVVSYGMLYNKAIFEACGIDGSTLKSYDDIDAAFAKVQAAIDNGELAEEFPLLEAVVALPAAEKWVLANHGSNAALSLEFGDAYSTYQAKELAFTYAQGYKDYIDLMIKYSTEADNPTALVAVDYDSAMGASFCLEKTAVIQMGQWANPVIAEIDETLLDKIGVLPIPVKGTKEDSICYGVGGFFSITNAGTDAEKAAAKDYLNWLFMSDEGRTFITSNISVPLDNYEDFPVANVISQACDVYAQEGKTMPLVFGGTPDGWLDLLGAGVQSYIIGEKTWDEVISEAQTNWAELRG